MSETTIAEYQLSMAKVVAAMQSKIADNQVKASEHYEAQMKAERESAEVALATARQTAGRAARQTANCMRPCMNFNVILCQDGEGWTADYGALSAYGDTPELAYQKFDEIWSGRFEL